MRGFLAAHESSPIPFPSRRALMHKLMAAALSVVLLVVLAPLASACIACGLGRPLAGGMTQTSIRPHRAKQGDVTAFLRLSSPLYALQKGQVVPQTVRYKPVAQAAPQPVSGDVWNRLRNCESSNGRTSPNGLYHGYFQFAMSTWRGVGGTGHPMDHSYEHQRALAQKLQARSGWGQWPSCSAQLGLR